MKTHTCPRCDGTGRIDEYGHIRDGVCFKCNGTGKVNHKPSEPKTWKPDPAVVAEYQRKETAAKELYKNDSRLRVTPDHEWYGAHAIELAKLDKIWDTP